MKHHDLPGTRSGNAADGRTRIDWPQVLLQTCRRIETAEPGTALTGLLGALGVSRAELQRQFRDRLGTTPKGYAQALRLTRLARGASRESSALAATLGAGFESAGRGYAAARAALGAPPGRLRSKLGIGYWIGLSDLGWMLMGATSSGICWLSFGDKPQQLLHDMQHAFPNAVWRADGQRLHDWFERVRDHILLPESALTLPVDIQGTAFQARVWRALSRIPLGETRSYGQLARTIGLPAAARAVAAACAANRVALLIPCHRVIASNGNVAGYRWGVARKMALLAREQVEQPAVAQMATSVAGSRRL